jgi:urease accessory protein
MDTGDGTAQTDAAQALIELMWLASPALPVGGFSYSEGLESAVESGQVHDEHSARNWLCDQLEVSLARGDLPALAHALDAWTRDDFQRIDRINAWVLATRETRELRRQTEQTARSLGDWLRNRGCADSRDAAALAHLAALTPAPTWPVAFALAARRSGAAARDALIAFGFGWAENQVQAALKSVPLGQNAGQRVLAALGQRLPAAVDRALATPPHERQAFTPMLAILSAQHEVQYSRLFRS